ncbi:hypothetical protein AwErysi_05640 [Erysipelotrichaceae bacterium]|nr:hypothetical protein AwErysi_05640 [Erysipelotrichaceae bacterium]
MAARTLNYFLETGNIKRSVNFPTVELGLQSALRFSIIHCNVPNMLGIMSTELAKHNINIINMLNRSRGDFAYTLIDMDDITPENLEALLQTLNAVEAIIRIRVIKAQA